MYKNIKKFFKDSFLKDSHIFKYVYIITSIHAPRFLKFLIPNVHENSQANQTRATSFYI